MNVGINNRHLLITGTPGCGKTTLIKKVVRHFSSWEVTGFWTNEVRKAGRRIGFDIVVVGGESGVLARVEKKSLKSPKFQVGRYYVSTIDLEILVVPILYLKSDLLIIDEIGKMEIFSSKFRQGLIYALNHHSCVLATIGRQSLPFLNSIKAREDVYVWELTRSNFEQIFEKIKVLLKQR
jgi:nucleoside-triphosphatase